MFLFPFHLCGLHTKLEIKGMSPSKVLNVKKYAKIISIELSFVEFLLARRSPTLKQTQLRLFSKYL